MIPVIVYACTLKRRWGAREANYDTGNSLFHFDRPTKLPYTLEQCSKLSILQAQAFRATTFQV